MSGTRCQDLRITVLPGGLVLSVRWTWPEFLLAFKRPEVESATGADIYYAETMAHQHSVCRLRPQDDEPVCVTIKYDRPIQCDKQIPENAIKCLAFQDDDRSAWHSCYLKVRLRGVRQGTHTPAIPVICVVRAPGAGAPPVAVPGAAPVGANQQQYVK